PYLREVELGGFQAVVEDLDDARVISAVERAPGTRFPQLRAAQNFVELFNQALSLMLVARAQPTTNPTSGLARAHVQTRGMAEDDRPRFASLVAALRGGVELHAARTHDCSSLFLRCTKESMHPMWRHASSFSVHLWNNETLFRSA